MAIPPSLKTLVPSLVRSGDSVTFSLADLKALLPSIEIDTLTSGRAFTGTVKMAVGDFRKILRAALFGVEVEEGWYLGQVVGLRQDIQKGKFASAAEHYALHGYLEGRLPERPVVDEKFYLQQYPDVAAAIKSGSVKSGFDHFVRDGYPEGRLPAAPKA